MEMKYLAFFPTWVPLLHLLPDNRVVAFIERVVDYATKGTEPSFSSETERAVFASIRMNIDDSIKRYNSRSETNRRNGKLGGLAKSQNRRARIASESDGMVENVA